MVGDRPCGCGADPIVFGHTGCQLGWVRSGGTTQRETGTLISHTQKYDPDVRSDSVVQPSRRALAARREWINRNVRRADEYVFSPD